MVGIVQEQHADRARLFMQWKQMDWPLMFDPLNQLGVDVVPVTLLLDEFGVVRYRNPSRDDVAEFLNTAKVDSTEAPPFRPRQPDSDLLRRAARSGEVDDLVAFADALVIWGGADELGGALNLYDRALQSQPDAGELQFRTGVAFRMRHDSNERHSGDFQRASSHWTQALLLNPNQYIWRRRIQQYGPRLQKPYAFFDWVEQARDEIRARGESPLELAVEPRGAELAAPVKELDSGFGQQEPDPNGRIVRDLKGFVGFAYTAVPSVVRPGEAARVHIELTPDAEHLAHWNNEVEGLEFWAESEVGSIDRNHQILELPDSVVSTETRHLELEISIPKGVSESVEVRAYALYYVCEDKGGACLYRRLDIPILINVSD